MRKLFFVVLIIVLSLTISSLAEGLTREEIESQIAELQAQLDQMNYIEDGTGNKDDISDTPDDTISSIEFGLLEKGSKGEEVKKLQQRLIELKYLTGSADGSYGNKTVQAIELYQKDADLPVTGIADPATQESLFSESAPSAKTYEKLNYKSILRDPNTYTGQYFKFTGTVFQLVGESEYDDYVYTVLFVATSGKYKDICNVTYLRPKNSPRILENDRVTIYAQCEGLYTYETIRGNSNTILDFTADSITN